jgi:hypothetical protein
MANGRVAELARQHAQEGAYLQVGGNFLPPASLRVRVCVCACGGGGRMRMG